MDKREIGSRALELEEADRADLAGRLLDSLGGADPNDGDGDSLSEAIRRGEDLKRGRVEGIPEAEFMDELRVSRRG